MNILLSKFDWHSLNGIHVTGFIRQGDRYLRNKELLNYFAEIDTIKKFEQKLKYANGQFSVVIISEDNLWAATDRLRNYPLFYTRANKEFLISDDCYLLAEKIPNKSLNPLAVNSFLAAGYTVNNLTLINEVYQVEAGEYISEGKSFYRNYYYESSLIPLEKKDFDILSEELNSLFSNVFESHFKALSDKFIVIPLSGGFDSRLIASMCARYHPENVLCYTYGIENNCEIANAKAVAKKLGFKWINIVYNSKLIDGYLEDDVFKQYYPYVSELSSMFFMQEYFAVKYLKDNQLIPLNSIFMPGFCGDMIAGSNLFPILKRNLTGKQLAKILYGEFCTLRLNSFSTRASIIKLIEDQLPEICDGAWRYFDNWDKRERQAKFNLNSAKVYSFFGYTYVLPLWDGMLEDFFFSLPFEYRLSKKLYDNVLREIIFKELDLNFQNELNPKPLTKSIQRFKEKIKKFVPYKMKDQFIKFESPIFYDQITKFMIDDLGPDEIIKPSQSNYYNSYITQWYLHKTRELLS